MSTTSDSNRQKNPAAAAGPKVKCPTCGKMAVYAASNPFRPFCSERCKSVDFGAWASESFRVDAIEPPDDEDGSRPGGAGPMPASTDWRH